MSSVEVEVFLPVIQGPPPFVHRGVWQAGAYLARDTVSHLGSTWFAARATVAAPGPAALDWSILLDGTGAAADRAAVAQDREAVAGDREAVTTARSEVLPAAEQVAGDRQAAETAAGLGQAAAANAAAAASTTATNAAVALEAKADTEAARADAIDAVAPVLPVVARIRQTTVDRSNVTADMTVNPALLLTIDAD